MKPGKYHKNVELRCPTCGGTQFESGDDLDAAHASVRCITCDRKMTKDELIRENRDNIQRNLSEIKTQAVEDAAEEMKKRLKTAFRGNKNIRIK